MTLDALLIEASLRLSAAGSVSPRLDAEVLLAHCLGRERTWLYTWGDQTCDTWNQARFAALVAARAQGQPIAYLTGEREFWGLALATSRQTLIPRPDTETLVEAALLRAPHGLGALLDMGTGTGAIALAFASERPGWQVVGVDIRHEAVELAEGNARRLGIANATFVCSHWFTALASTAAPARFDLIVANPPYIAENDPHLEQGDVRFEPRSALVAAEQGMADLHHLIKSAQGFLHPEGYLLLEHGYTQAAAVRQAFISAGYENVESLCDLAGQERVTLGCFMTSP
ncbi:peptide chain release factor N(5)-glutamine methyltransferase [Halomonas sp. TBZ9]|uniref:Release factor glutamine methyltransferase n=1 Tax=Vreelandella azerica TaxID=2732867 RepID=A0A7Y3TYP4_9GAMM|nr:peptide chain release factor N(5)-glutamine methyltransferase [Halomonas azerica]NOG32633.1 peptide chain release factor N(5)-glutamine methyltransferase [Halomonas azerica]